MLNGGLSPSKIRSRAASRRKHRLGGKRPRQEAVAGVLLNVYDLVVGDLGAKPGVTTRQTATGPAALRGAAVVEVKMRVKRRVAAVGASCSGEP